MGRFAAESGCRGEGKNGQRQGLYGVGVSRVGNEEFMPFGALPSLEASGFGGGCEGRLVLLRGWETIRHALITALFDGRLSEAELMRIRGTQTTLTRRRPITTTSIIGGLAAP
jgi:hypothetical protein